MQCGTPAYRGDERHLAFSSGQFLQQRPGLLQIARVESFGEPAVDRSKQFASLIPLALIAPEPRHAHRGAQFPWLAYAFPYRRFAVALAGDRARLRVDADRYSFIVSDLHRLLLAGLSGALRKTLMWWMAPAPGI